MFRAIFIFVFCSVIIFPGCAFYDLKGGYTKRIQPQAMGKIALFTFSNDHQGLSDLFISGLVDLGYQVMEKGMVDQIWQESKNQSDPELNIEKACALGSLVGAKTIIVGNYTQENKQSRTLSIRAVNVKERTIVFSIHVKCEGTAYVAPVPSWLCQGDEMVHRALEDLKAPKD